MFFFGILLLLNYFLVVENRDRFKFFFDISYEKRLNMWINMRIFFFYIKKILNS